MAQEPHYKYFAFISYSSKDTEWGKRVQRKLEGYRMPATLCSEHGWERNPIKPVFFDGAKLLITWLRFRLAQWNQPSPAHIR